MPRLATHAPARRYLTEGQLLKVTTETVGTRQVKLTIEPEQDVVQRAMRRAAKRISQMRPVAGFRPGRAPYAMVERIFGRDMILDQALSETAKDIYKEAIEQAELKPYQPGELDIASRDPLVLTVEVPLMPVVDLGDYRALRITPEPEVAVTEEQIDSEVEAVRRRLAEYIPVERAVALGDQVVVTIKGSSEGEQVLDQENATLTLTDEMMPPGFAEALVGTNPGETRAFSLTYPDDFENDELAGKNVDFGVTVNTVRQVNLPAVDDDLAKAAGDHETLADLRQFLAEKLRERLTMQARQREADAALNALVEAATIEYPQAAVEREIDATLDEFKGRIRRAGYEFDAFLRMTGQTEAQLREEARPRAESQLRRHLVITEYARAEGITVSQSELEEEMGRVASTFADRLGDRAVEALEQFHATGGLLSLFSGQLTEKAVEHLTDRLTGRLPAEEQTAEEAVVAETAAESPAEPAAEDQASQTPEGDAE